MARNGHEGKGRLPGPNGFRIGLDFINCMAIIFPGPPKCSLEPTIRHKDIVIIDPEDREINPKSIYAVRLDTEGGCAVKRVRISNEYAVLLSDNPEFDPIILPKDRAENLIIGRVIWSWTSWVR